MYDEGVWPCSFLNTGCCISNISRCCIWSKTIRVSIWLFYRTHRKQCWRCQTLSTWRQTWRCIIAFSMHRQGSWRCMLAFSMHRQDPWRCILVFQVLMILASSPLRRVCAVKHVFTLELLCCRCSTCCCYLSLSTACFWDAIWPHIILSTLVILCTCCLDCKQLRWQWRYCKSTERKYYKPQPASKSDHIYGWWLWRLFFCCVNCNL